VATCLEPISALVVLPGSTPVALAAERTTGRILQVQRQRPNKELAALTVDPAGDGGLTGLALSPSYAEDELIYAYITTPIDNRVVRIAPGDMPKPVLAGIPRGITGNAGALAVDSYGMLLVATGDAGIRRRPRIPSRWPARCCGSTPLATPRRATPPGPRCWSAGCTRRVGSVSTR